MLKELSRFMRDVSYTPNQLELSSLVRKRCPDIPRNSEGASADDDPDRPEGPRTAAMPKRKVGNETGQHVTFATRIALADLPPSPAGRRGIVPVALGAAALLAVAAVGAVVLRPSHPAAPDHPPGVTAPPPPKPAEPPPKKMGKLSVKSDPPAEVRVGDKLLGTSPLEAEVPLEGAINVSLRRRGYTTVERTLQPGAELTVTEKLQPLPRGRLTLNALPWAHVFIDGEKAPDTPISKMSITAGPHTIKLQCPPTGREYKLNVVVDPDEDVRRVVDLRGEPRVSE
jgi:hypothetical protein